MDCHERQKKGMGSGVGRGHAAELVFSEGRAMKPMGSGVGMWLGWEAEDALAGVARCVWVTELGIAGGGGW